jgi:uncharacterized protein
MPDWNLDTELREILVCPACHGPLEDQDEGLSCPACHVLYPVIEDVPLMIREEASPWPR